MLSVTFVPPLPVASMAFCYTVYDASARFARHAVVPRWTRFISAFPARRLFLAYPKLK
jgi:hypothetical protein